MKFLNVYAVAAVLLLPLPGIAQKSNKELNKQAFKQLHVGDTVPEVLLNRMYNFPAKSGKLSDFKGKALILDFWNHGCSGCISAMPKMEQLRNEFKDDLEVLMVTWQPIEEFAHLFKNSPIVKGSKLPMAFSNDVLQNLFPHLGEPYHVWIDKAGLVRGMTSAWFATAENVKDLIAGKPLKMAIKEHLVLTLGDLRYPKLCINDGELAKYVLSFNKIIPSEKEIPDEKDTTRTSKSLINLNAPYYSMLMKSLYHLGAGGSAGGSIINPLTGENIGHKTGGDLLSLYKTAYGVDQKIKVIIEDGGDQYYDPGRNASPMEKEQYFKNAHFIYELAYPEMGTVYDSAKSRGILKKDLEYVFGLKGYLELRDLKCLVLYRNMEADRLSSKGGAGIFEDTKSMRGFIINNMSFGVLPSYFTGLMNEKEGPVLIDETGIDWNRKVDMVLHNKMDDIPALNLELTKYGLGIKEETRLLPAFILRKN